MKDEQNNLIPEKCAYFFFTIAFWKICEKVEREFSANPSVDLLRNCGVEREKFLKILWKTKYRKMTFSQSVETGVFEKVETLSENILKHGKYLKIFSTKFSTHCGKLG